MKNRWVYTAAAILAVCLAAQGCVYRTLTVKSDPPGAEAYLDNEHIGTTPVTVPFRHYGTREIRVEKDGFAPARKVVEIHPPWYQLIILDLICEVIIPYNFRDRREFTLALEKPDADRKRFLERAGAERRKYLMEEKKDGE